MPLPEGYLPRKGDELLTRSRVTYNVELGDTDVHLAMVGAEHRKYIIPISEVDSLYRRAWNVDDRVSAGHFDGPGEVIAVDGEDVWVRDTQNMRWTIDANQLESYVEPLETMTEAELMAGLEPLLPPGSQSVVGDDEEIKF